MIIAPRLTVNRGIERLRSQSGRWLWALWSKLQLCDTPVLRSILGSRWRDDKNRGHLNGGGRRKVSEGVVINLALASVPPYAEVLNRSNILHLTQQLVLFSFHHGTRVVHGPDRDAIRCFCGNVQSL